MGRPHLLPRVASGLRDAVDRAQRDVGLEPRAPWSPTNTQYRQNVIIFVKRLRELGARPFLLLSTRPFTDGEAGDWWREASLYTDFVREIYFNARQIHGQGGSGRGRCATRSARA